MYKTYFIKRNELYEMVWTIPMVKIAKEYGVSDKAIAKICNKLNVPVPGVGHWRKLKTEHEVFKTPQPQLIPGDKYEYELKIKNKKENELSEKYRLLIEQEENPNNKIEVKDKLKKAHPLVYQARELLLDSDGKMRMTRTKALNISVSPVNLKRSLRILNTLILELEKRRFIVKAMSNYHGRAQTMLYYDDQDIEIDLRELTKYTRVKKESGYYYNKNDEYERRLVPTGLLQLEIKSHWMSGATRIVRDNKNRKLEDQLNFFIICLYRIVNYDVHRHKIWEEERKRDDEKRRIQQEILEKEGKEKEKIQELEKNVKDWYFNNLIREYLVKYKERLLDDSLTDDQRNDIYHFIEWAFHQAVKIDPFVDEN